MRELEFQTKKVGVTIKVGVTKSPKSRGQVFQYHMMTKDLTPILQLTDLSTTSKKDEQRGFRFIFSGSVVAIRNPRGHEYGIKDTPTECLDHLSLASMLLRRLEQAG